MDLNEILHGGVVDIDVLRKKLNFAIKSVEQLKHGLEDEKKRLSEFKSFLGRNPAKDEAIKRGIVSIEVNIRNIRRVLEEEIRRRDACMGGIVAAEEILRRHDEARGRAGNNGIPK